MAAQITLVPQDIIRIINHEPRTTSLKVAEAFGKQHKHVLARIESLDCTVDFASANFSAQAQTVKIDNGATRQTKYYEMTKDGFMFLVMGFTGHKAAGIKEAYINAFNWMAAQLHGGPAAPAPAGAIPRSVLQFNGVPVYTFKRLAEAFGVGHDQLRALMSWKSEQFAVGVTHFKLSGPVLRDFMHANLPQPDMSRRICRELVVFSRQGAEALASVMPQEPARRGLAVLDAQLRAGQPAAPAASALPDLGNAAPGTRFLLTVGPDRNYVVTAVQEGEWLPPEPQQPELDRATRGNVERLCQHVIWLRSWWHAFGDSLRVLNPRLAATIHDRFIEASSEASVLGSRLNLTLPDRRRLDDYPWLADYHERQRHWMHHAG